MKQYIKSVISWHNSWLLTFSIFWLVGGWNKLRQNCSQN